MPKLVVRATAEAFDNKNKRHYRPGDLAQIDSDSPLADLKTPTGKQVFVEVKTPAPAIEKPR